MGKIAEKLIRFPLPGCIEAVKALEDRIETVQSKQGIVYPYPPKLENGGKE